MPDSETTGVVSEINEATHKLNKIDPQSKEGPIQAATIVRSIITLLKHNDFNMLFEDCLFDVYLSVVSATPRPSLQACLRQIPEILLRADAIKDETISQAFITLLKTFKASFLEPLAKSKQSFASCSLWETENNPTKTNPAQTHAPIKIK